MLASSMHESLRVQSLSSEPAWITTEIMVGASIGMYMGFTEHFYGDTCFTNAYSFAMDGIYAGTYFNTGVDLDHWWDGVTALLTFGLGYGLGPYWVYDACWVTKNE